jgi:flagellar M-ring protein FliF
LQNLLQIWLGLDGRKRFIVFGATLAVFMTVFGMSRMTGNSEMSLLYAGLDSATAGDVIAALDARAAKYAVRGEAIFVQATERDSLRMILAAEGLPKNSGTGYELLDSLSGFGTTAQMFDAAYWRAKEGELARTILANPQIRGARVHIAQAPSAPFQRAIKPSASVTITSVGGNLAPLQAKALRHLIAASVPGMTPDEVSVIDSVAGLIPSENDNSAPNATADSKAAEIKQNVERLLAARVGAGKAVVEVAVDVVTDSESIKERRFDPQGRVAVSTDNTQQTGSSTAGGKDVTVASNLPNNTASGSGAKNDSSETRERANYEVSETNRELIKSPGAVRKISIAVLVDGAPVTAADGTITNEPRPEAELAMLRELVTSAAGLDTGRGDVLTLKSMVFEPTPLGTGEIAQASMFSFGVIDVMTLVQTAVLALVALVLGLFVIRPILTSNARAAFAGDAEPLALSGFGDMSNGPVLNGEIDDGFLPPLSMVSGDGGGDDDSDPVSRLRRLIEERQSESVEILRGWMEQEEEVQ